MKKSILLLLCCIGTFFFLSAQAPARLFLQQQDTASVGGQVCVQVLGGNFQKLDSLQLSVRYSANALKWKDAIQPAGGLAGVEISAQKTYDGLLRVTLKNTANAQGITIGDSLVLFELCFEALQPTFGNEYVGLVNHPLPVRAFDVNQQSINILESNQDWIETIHIFPTEEIYLAIEDTVVAPGQPFCRKLRLISTDKPLISMQFSLGWDPAIIRLDSVINLNLYNFRADRDFNLTITNQGKLSCLWQDERARGVTQDSVAYLYEVCFTALDSVGNSAVKFTQSPTSIEFISADFNLLRSYFTTADINVDSDPFMRPGDTNHDGAVDHFDLLNIGLGYGNIGENRKNANFDWKNQPVANWEQQSPLSQTNYKHFDTDGNGLIESNDARAIDINWNSTTEDGFTEDNRTEIREEGVPLYVQTKKIVPNGKPVTFDIVFGEASKKAENVYGLAFSIEYADLILTVDSQAVFATFDSTWLGKPGEDLLVLQRNNPTEHRLDIALVRIDGQNQTGFGTIAQLNFTSPIFTGETPPGTDTVGVLPFHIQNVRAIDFDEIEQLTAPMETAAVVDISTSISNPALAHKIQVFPNPAKDVLLIRTSDTTVKNVILYNVNGQIILQSYNDTTFSIESLQTGLYLCKIITDQGFVTKRIAIVR